MDLENKLYMVIGVSTVFFLFGFALILNNFPDNWIAVLLIVLICSGLSIAATFYISEMIESVELTKKTAIVGSCMFLLFLLLTIFLLILYFPGDLVAYLIGIGSCIMISLPIIYISIRELSPLEATTKAEIVLTIIIGIIGISTMVVLFLNDLIGLLLTSALCLILYLIIFLIIQFAKSGR